MGLVPGSTLSPCRLSTINRLILLTSGNGFGNIWATPGFTNIGIPDFSETEVSAGFASFNPTAIIPVDTNGDGLVDTGLIDPDGDGLTDVDLQTQQWNFNGSDRERSGNLFSPSTRISVYAYGNYDLVNESNTSFYFEALYSQRETDYFFPGAQLFPEIPDANPYNPCSVAAGRNCRQFFGIGPLSKQDIQPVVVVRGDRESNDIKLKQLQVTGGVQGDLVSWQNSKGFGNWGYDFYISYSTSKGTDRLEGILDAQLKHSLQTSAIHSETGEVVCGVDDNMDGNPDGIDPWGAACVPINMLAPSLYQPGGGTFATQAERDYVFGVRGFDATEVKQTLFSGILQGDLFNLPWNNTSVPLVVGVEYRKDEIDSNPNVVARDGLFFGFFSDGGAQGSRNISELFFETEFQLLEDVRFADAWSLNLSARWTDESTYGDDITYSAKTFYKLNDSITLRATYGTSFRAPNAREQFLIGTSGFSTIYDPCVVPTDARSAGLTNEPATYDPRFDGRTMETLDNCRANGVDPLMLGLQGEVARTSYSVESFTRGGDHVRLTVSPETSASKTYGFVLDQPFWDDLTLRFGMTYYEIKVEDTISRLSAGGLVYDCLVESESVYCPLFTRDDNGLLDVINRSYININSVSSHGIDYNVYASRDFILADRNLNVALDIVATRLLENEYRIGTDYIEDDARTPYAPEWEVNLNLILEYSDFRVIWRTNYISGEDEHIYYNGLTDLGFDIEPPCSGLGVQCRPYHRTPDYFTHTLSFTWQPQDWSFTVGVVNLFDEEPPLLDSDVPETQRNNIPVGAGYDILGRRVFASVRRSL